MGHVHGWWWWNGEQDLNLSRRFWRLSRVAGAWGQRHFETLTFRALSNGCGGRKIGRADPKLLWKLFGALTSWRKNFGVPGRAVCGVSNVPTKVGFLLKILRNTCVVFGHFLWQIKKLDGTCKYMYMRTDSRQYFRLVSCSSSLRVSIEIELWWRENPSCYGIRGMWCGDKEISFGTFI